MDRDYRTRLTNLLARIDQQLADVESVLDDLAETDVMPHAVEVCALLTDMRNYIENKLERLAKSP